MAAISSTEAACPGCGKKVRLRAEAMGKKVKCGCGTVFVAAAAVPAPTVEADLELDIQPSAAAPAVAMAPPLPPAAAPRVHSPVAKALLEREDDARDSSLREWWLPVIMLVAGYLIQLGLWWCWLPSAGSTILVAAVALAVQSLVFAPALFAGLMFAAKWFDVSLGPLPSMVRKIAALTFGPAAIADVLFVATLILANFDWQLIAAGFGYYIVLMGISTAILLETGVADTAFLVLVSFVPRVVAAYPSAVILGDLNWFR